MGPALRLRRLHGLRAGVLALDPLHPAHFGRADHLNRRPRLPAGAPDPAGTASDPDRNRALVALGGNVGDREACLRGAVAALGGLPRTRVLSVSSLYETDPVGGPAQGPYLNACVVLDTALAAEDLLRELLVIEAAAGRVRTVPNAPRTLDLDLLFFGDAILDRPGLTVPHPRMLERAFVLVPAREIAPDRRHPRTGRTLSDHTAELPTSATAAVCRYRPAGWATA